MLIVTLAFVFNAKTRYLAIFGLGLTGMLKSPGRSGTRGVSRPIFDGVGLGFEGCDPNLEASGLINISETRCMLSG